MDTTPTNGEPDYGFDFSKYDKTEVKIITTTYKTEDWIEENR